MNTLGLIELKRPVVFYSSLTIDSCLRRLADNTDGKESQMFSLTRYAGKRPVIALINGREVELFKRKRWWARNDFAPAFSGQFLEDHRGVVLEGNWGLERYTRIFMRVWFFLVTVIGMVLLISWLPELLKKPDREFEDWMGIAIAAGLPVLGWLFLNSPALLTSREKTYLNDFLREMLASPIDKDAQ